jgi:exopolysaccharide production protein ExoQ
MQESLASTAAITGPVSPARRRPPVWPWAALLLVLTSPLAAGGSADLGPDTGSTAYRYLRDATLFISAAALALHGERAGRVLRAAWPLVLFGGYAAASLAWSDDLLASRRALAAGLPLWMAAAAASVALGRNTAAALLGAMALACLGSVGAALLLPERGLTGVHDLAGAGAAGSWRGLYLHKNVLGHVAGLTAGALGGRYGRLIGPGPLRWVCLAAAVACTALSRSAAGLALALALPLLARAPWRWAVAALTGLAALAQGWAVLAPSGGPGGGATLLGRDMSFSGRTDIWRAGWSAAAERPVFGRGLDGAIAPDFATELAGRFGVNHVHSAGLDILLALGGAGLGLAALAVWRALAAGGPPSSGAERGLLRLLVLGWLASGLVEDMAVRPEGPLALIGATALWGLFGLAVEPQPPRQVAA